MMQKSQLQELLKNIRVEISRADNLKAINNIATLLEKLMAYNLGNFLRRLALPKSVKKWSLRTLREKLIKIGAKVVKHSRYVVFQMAGVVVPRALFREILERIRQLRSSPELARTG